MACAAAAAVASYFSEAAAVELGTAGALTAEAGAGAAASAAEAAAIGYSGAPVALGGDGALFAGGYNGISGGAAASGSGGFGGLGTFGGKVSDAAISGLGGQTISALVGKSGGSRQLPGIPQPAAMPTPNDQAVKLAKRRSLSEQLSRQGRASTILSQDNGMFSNTLG